MVVVAVLSKLMLAPVLAEATLTELRRSPLSSTIDSTRFHVLNLSIFLLLRYVFSANLTPSVVNSCVKLDPEPLFHTSLRILGSLFDMRKRVTRQSCL